MQRFQQTRQALGSTAYLTVLLADDKEPSAIFEALWHEIDLFEKRFSRFLPDSELTKLNNSAGTSLTVSNEMRQLLLSAIHMAQQTEGLYNPFILPSLQKAGYVGSWPMPQLVNDTPNYQNRALADWKQLVIHEHSAEIPKNTAIDFGGIGKGYLLEQLALLLAKMDIQHYWLSLGGDILCNGYDLETNSWHIGIQNIQNSNKIVATVDSKGEKTAVATSGITKRQGVNKNVHWHHLIDPRTGKSADTDILSATVCSENALTADIAAKCLIIAGSKTAHTTLDHIGEHNALLQVADNADVQIIRMGEIW
jgi:thiamine biosynthesis lipoprotein